MDPLVIKAQGDNAQSLRLRFSIARVTSEDPMHPASQLTMQNPQTRGWCSESFCEFPQELLLRTDGLCMVQRLQILSHQSRISSKIEIYAGEEGNIKRLGYTSMDSNERSDYKARELKTVPINCKAQFIRLVFHKCHINKYNLYNQVGLIAISLIGYPLVNRPTSEQRIKRSNSTEPSYSEGLRARVPSGQMLNDLMYDLNFDPATAESIRMLEKEKDRCIKSEDYDEAKKIKIGIEYLRQIGADLAKLDAKKADAVEHEEYDQAKIIKLEMDQLRALASQKMKQYQLSKYIVHYGGGRERAIEIGVQGNMDETAYNYAPRNEPPPRPLSRKQSIPNTIAPMANPPSILDAPSPKMTEAMTAPPKSALGRPEIAAGTIKTDPDDRPIKPRKDLQFPDDAAQTQGMDTLRMSAKNMPIDERPIRPMQNAVFDEPADSVDTKSVRSSFDKMKIDQKRVPGKPGLTSPRLIGSKEPITAKGDQLPDPEPLSDAVAKESKFIINIFGERTVRCLYSRIWNLREKGIEEVKEGLVTYDSDTGSVFKACCKVLPKLLSDTTQMISLRAMELFCSLIGFASKLPSSDVVSGLESVIPLVVNKTADSNPKNRERALDSVVFAAKAKNITGVVVAPLVLSVPVNANAKVLTGRLIVIERLVHDLKLAKNSGLTLQNAMTFAVAQLGHSSPEVRSQAMKVISQLYLCVGEPKLQPFLKDQKPAVLSALKVAFQEAEQNRSDGDEAAQEDEPPASQRKAGTQSMKMSKKPPVNPKALSVVESSIEESRVETEDEFTEDDEPTPAKKATQKYSRRKPDDDLTEGSEEDEAQQDIYINIKLVPNRDGTGGYSAVGMPNPTVPYNPAPPNPYVGPQEPLTFGGLSLQQQRMNGSLGQTQRPQPQQRTLPLNQSSLSDPHEDAEAEQDGPDDAEVCAFCHYTDPDMTEEKMDDHHYNDCPMLTQCPECREVTEIPMLDFHLLDECAQKEKYTRCKDCQAVLLSNLLAVHAPKCKPLLDPDDASCPLCQNLVRADGWEDHLMKPPGCPKNPRTRKMKKDYEEAKLKSVSLAKPLVVNKAPNRAGPSVKSGKK
eukprot:TRINITY_DN11235_c0_g1_i3.p1 TRINITY_DN11235_c0_g1~~TRINITY_DN11235_c0_g1_i3.p1  ORF type:complete len:1076 (+),score=204.72 TRINITY_DN11235_c0_g1_i3:46-3273(+)